jgi:hypothetical protein
MEADPPLVETAFLLIAEAEIKNPASRLRNGVSLIHYSIILPPYLVWQNWKMGYFIDLVLVL